MLPAEYSATNTVYEYGGPAYAILNDDRIVFSNKDHAVYILKPDTKEVSRLTGGTNLRYSNFEVDPNSHWVIANEEDHTIDTPDKVRNRIVAINVESGEVKRVLESADFYYLSNFSPDGKKLTWLEWDHPDLPFDAAKLYWADWSAEGLVSKPRFISGGKGHGVAEPHWGTDGSLFFGQETGEFRTLFRIPAGKEDPAEVKLNDLENAEFGEVRWYQGRQVDLDNTGDDSANT